MSVLGALDAIAVKAKTMTGIKEVWTATGSAVSTTLRPIPSRLDDGPVGVVWIGAGDMVGGNAEGLVFNPTLDIWVQARDAGVAYKTLAAYPDIAMTTFRADLDLGGQVTRCIVRGWDELETETVNNAAWLILPIRLEVLILRLAHDATA